MFQITVESSAGKSTTVDCDTSYEHLCTIPSFAHVVNRNASQLDTTTHSIRIRGFDLDVQHLSRCIDIKRVQDIDFTVETSVLIQYACIFQFLGKLQYSEHILLHLLTNHTQLDHTELNISLHDRQMLNRICEGLFTNTSSSLHSSLVE